MATRAKRYGRERERIYQEWVKNQDRRIADEISGTYQLAADSIQRETEAWLTRFSKAQGVTPAEALKTVSNADMKALERKAKYYVDKRWKDNDVTTPFTDKANREMREYNFAMKLSRHEYLLRSINMELTDMAVSSDKLVKGYLQKMTGTELKRQAGLLGLRNLSPEELTRNIGTIVNASFHGTTFSERIWKYQSGLRESLHEGIAEAMLMGKNPTTWMGKFTPYLKDGIQNTTHAMRRLAITESGRVQIEAQRKSYIDAGYTQYEVVCEITACEICMEHDGEIYEVSRMRQGENAPVFHPYCKCSTAAAVDRQEIEALLESKDDEYRTYATIEEADAEFRPITAELWRNDWTPQEKTSLVSYTRSSRNFNTPLRAGYELTNEIESVISALDKSSLSENTQFSRGSSVSGLSKFLGIPEDDILDNIELTKELVAGREFTEHAFLSTSVTEETHWSGKVRYKVYCPEGTKGAYLEPISFYSMDPKTRSGQIGVYDEVNMIDADVHARGENEFLIQAGTRYRIQDMALSEAGDILVNMIITGQP